MFRFVTVVVVLVFVVAAFQATIAGTNLGPAPKGTAAVLVFLVLATGFYLGRRFSQAGATATANARAEAKSASISRAAANARAQQMVVIQNYAAQMEASVTPLRVEDDGYGDDVDFEELEGGDGESAQAGGGALTGVPDPYLLPVAPTPSCFPIASSRRLEGLAVNLPAVTETSPAEHVHAGAASTFPRVDGQAVGPMIARGEHEAPAHLGQWPFPTDDRPGGGEHVR